MFAACGARVRHLLIRLAAVRETPRTRHDSEHRYDVTDMIVLF